MRCFNGQPPAKESPSAAYCRGLYYVLKAEEAQRLVEPPSAVVVAMDSIPWRLGSGRSPAPRRSGVRRRCRCTRSAPRGALLGGRPRIGPGSSTGFRSPACGVCWTLLSDRPRASGVARKEDALALQRRRPVERLEPLRTPLAMLFVHLPEQLDDLRGITRGLDASHFSTGCIQTLATHRSRSTATIQPRSRTPRPRTLSAATAAREAP